MKITGLDQLERRLQAMQRNGRDLSGTRDVPIAELFSPAFMRRHTDFGDFQELVDASGIQAAEDIGSADWERIVQERTHFNDWSEMQQAGATEYVKKGLGF